MAGPASFQNFFKDREYSDITIKVSGREIPCHKMIICTQSEYFKKLCGIGSRFAESNQKIVELKEDDPDAIEAIIRQLYFGNYSSGASGRAKDWKFHAEVFIAATKYLVPTAAQSATTCCILLLDDLRSVSDIYDAILYIRAKCSHNERLMQKAGALEAKHMNKLLADDRFIDSLSKEEVREHFDRLRKFIGNSFERTGRLCPNCGTMVGRTGRCNCTGQYERVKETKYFITIANDQ